MKINRGERNRVFVIFIFFSLWGLFIGAALVKTQVLDYGEHTAKVKRQRNRVLTLHARRGTIYDSKGEILAISVKAKSAFLSSKDKQESLALFDRIRRVIRFNEDKDKNWQEIKDIKSRIKEGKKFIWIKRKLTESEYERLRETRGGANAKSELDFLEEYKRIYPQKSTACHILGGVGIDEQGLAGIEFELDSIIKGRGSKVEVLIDARQKTFSQKYLMQPVYGRDIYLTIDVGVQFFVERELEKTVKKYKARGGCVIVMDAQDGSILAMASYPDYRPDRLKDTSPWVQKNRAISFLYSPGSTFKIILAATALENNVCYPQQVFNCYNGVYRIMDETIYDDHPTDRLTFEEIIIRSSNIGAARIGLRLGKKKYYNGIKKFGFGSKMGIYLPGEERGILRPVKDWSGVSVAFLAHGYEILVTPLQMARAFNVLASGGYLVQPHVVKGIERARLKRGERVKILAASSRERLTSIMTKVVEVGTGKKTRLEGIEIAGKTGTTKKGWGKGKGKNGKEDNSYVSSFGGFFPAQNPRVTMFVVIDEPAMEYYGGEVAAPLFKSIAEKLLVYLNIFPELDKKNEIRI